MEHRGSGNDHVAWARKLKELLQALGSYVKQHHATGPAWNAGGVPASQFSGASQQPCCLSQVTSAGCCRQNNWNLVSLAHRAGGESSGR